MALYNLSGGTSSFDEPGGGFQSPDPAAPPQRPPITTQPIDPARRFDGTLTGPFGQTMAPPGGTLGTIPSGATQTNQISWAMPPATATSAPSAPAGGSPFRQNILEAMAQAGITPSYDAGSGRGDVQYWENVINQGGGWSPYWADRIRNSAQIDAQGAAQGGMGQPAGGFMGTGGIFDDPSTKAFENLINQRIGQLQTPFQNPDLQPAVDYLRQYFQQLQGPAFTPQQMDLMQTQQFDPLMQQRDQARQQIVQHFAAHGLGPDSGPVQQALLQSDQAYERLGTQARAGVASNAIGVQKQQQQQAASLGRLIAQLQQGQFNSQQGRQDQAVNLASIMPNLAWNRILGANALIQPVNAGSLFNPLQSFQQQGAQQGAQFSNGLMQVLPYLMQLFQTNG